MAAGGLCPLGRGVGGWSAWGARQTLRFAGGGCPRSQVKNCPNSKTLGKGRNNRAPMVWRPCDGRAGAQAGTERGGLPTPRGDCPAHPGRRERSLEACSPPIALPGPWLVGRRRPGPWQPSLPPAVPWGPVGWETSSLPRRATRTHGAALPSVQTPFPPHRRGHAGDPELSSRLPVTHVPLQPLAQPLGAGGRRRCCLRRCSLLAV